MYQKIYVEDYDDNTQWINKDAEDVEAELSVYFVDVKLVMAEMVNSPMMKIRTPFAFYRWVNQETSQPHNP